VMTAESPQEAGAADAAASPEATAGAPAEAPGEKRKRVGSDEAASAAAPEANAERIKQFIEGLRFSRPISDLEDPAVKQRLPCPECGKRRQYYCYDCVVPTDSRAMPLEPVRLPLKVHVVLHPGEHRGKATSVHAGVVSPDVRLYTHPAVPEGLDSATTLLAYPGPGARTIDQLQKDGVLEKVTGVVFIDSTWQQSKSIMRDERLKQFIPVQLNEYRTIFWRFQNTGDDRFLATIEAIYYFLRDSFVANGGVYKGQFDDIMYHYVHQYCLIQETYRSGSRPFTKRHQNAKGYIQSAIDFSSLLGRQAAKPDAAQGSF